MKILNKTFLINFNYKHLSTTCTYEPKNENETLTEEDPCWINLNSISRMNAYRM